MSAHNYKCFQCGATATRLAEQTPYADPDSGYEWCCAEHKPHHFRIIGVSEDLQRGTAHSRRMDPPNVRVYEIVVNRGEVYDILAASEEEALEAVATSSPSYSEVVSTDVWSVKDYVDATR